MHIIYVDESGMPDLQHPAQYYVLSGVLVYDNYIKDVKRAVFNYKQRFFKDGYTESEIHTQNMYNSKRSFSGLTGLDVKYHLFDNLYKMIMDLPILVISVAIDKKLLDQIHPSWKIFNFAWTTLVTRFDQYLESHRKSEKTIIKIDKSTSKNKSELDHIFEEIRSHKHKHQRIDNIEGIPIFVNSDAIEGIQVADAISYCTTRYLEKKSQFTNYWEMVKNTMYVKDGKLFGYGLNVFPSDNKIKDGDTQS